MSTYIPVFWSFKKSFLEMGCAVAGEETGEPYHCRGSILERQIDGSTIFELYSKYLRKTQNPNGCDGRKDIDPFSLSTCSDFAQTEQGPLCDLGPVSIRARARVCVHVYAGSEIGNHGTYLPNT